MRRHGRGHSRHVTKLCRAQGRITNAATGAGSAVDRRRRMALGDVQDLFASRRRTRRPALRDRPLQQHARELVTILTGCSPNTTSRTGARTCSTRPGSFSALSAKSTTSATTRRAEDFSNPMLTTRIGGRSTARSFSRARCCRDPRPVGQNSDEVLRQYGYNEAEIASCAPRGWWPRGPRHPRSVRGPTLQQVAHAVADRLALIGEIADSVQHRAGLTSPDRRNRPCTGARRAFRADPCASRRAPPRRASACIARRRQRMTRASFCSGGKLVSRCASSRRCFARSTAVWPSVETCPPSPTRRAAPLPACEGGALALGPIRVLVRGNEALP